MCFACDSGTLVEQQIEDKGGRDGRGGNDCDEDLSGHKIGQPLDTHNLPRKGTNRSGIGGNGIPGGCGAGRVLGSVVTVQTGCIRNGDGRLEFGS